MVASSEHPDTPQEEPTEAQTESPWQSKRGARSARGEETRTALIDAAEELFLDNQYEAVRVADIVAVAGTSHGTFYKYFPTKEIVFDELVHRLEDRLLGRPDGAQGSPDTPIRERIRAANRNYLAAFREYRNILVILDYGTPTEPALRETQRRFRDLFVERVRRNIARWQSAGLIDPQIDPHYAASALGGMVSRFAYMSYVVGESFDDERAVEQLSLLWSNALGIRTGATTPPSAIT